MSASSPRHYAKAYLDAQGKDAQRAALKGCPVEWQGLVRAHISILRSHPRYSHISKRADGCEKNTKTDTLNDPALPCRYPVLNH